jgi:hypothetical protein
MKTTLHPRGVAHLAGLVVGTLAYLASWLRLIPVLVYEPATGRFTMTPDPQLIAMSYYGLLLWGVVAYGLGYWGFRALSAAPQPSAGAARLWVRVAGAVLVAGLVGIAAVELRHATGAKAGPSAEPRSGVDPPVEPAAG